MFSAIRLFCKFLISCILDWCVQLTLFPRQVVCSTAFALLSADTISAFRESLSRVWWLFFDAGRILLCLKSLKSWTWPRPHASARIKPIKKQTISKILTVGIFFFLNITVVGTFQVAVKINNCRSASLNIIIATKRHKNRKKEKNYFCEFCVSLCLFKNLFNSNGYFLSIACFSLVAKSLSILSNASYCSLAADIFLVTK